MLVTVSCLTQNDLLFPATDKSVVPQRNEVEAAIMEIGNGSRFVPNTTILMFVVFPNFSEVQFLFPTIVDLGDLNKAL